MTTVRRSMVAMGLFAALSLSAPALADDLVVNYQPETGFVTRSMAIDISDLQLSTPKGREKLNSRIHFAAKAVCDYNGGYGLRQGKDYDRCYDKATSDALSDTRLVQTASR